MNFFNYFCTFCYPELGQYPVLPLHTVGGGDGPGVAEQGGAALVQERGCNERGYEAGLEAGGRTPHLSSTAGARPATATRRTPPCRRSRSCRGGTAARRWRAPPRCRRCAGRSCGGRVNESIVPPNWDLGSIPGAGVLSSEGFVEPRCFPTDFLICHRAQRQGVEVGLLRIVLRRGRGRRAS